MEYDIQLYDKLLELPLFQGMSRNDLTSIVAHTKLGFHKFQPNHDIVQEGDTSDCLYFLLSGVISVYTSADDHGYTFCEEISAPEALQPERIFGLTQRYTHTYKTKTVCNFITLDKYEVLKLSDKFSIFRFSLLNMICTLSQKASHQSWRIQPKDLRGRIIRFFETHCIRPAGKKNVHIKMTRLAEEVNDSRINVSHVLNQLESENLIQLSRSIISIPVFEKLMIK